ncbi:hypothetical protein PV08_10133 [Exophiala spinifera]|uniref:DUF3533 domain-containing protein n=1 Tax=Exophiala spinifera TaxID=91928 RepID=A0A0D2BHJ2_9EURO|nr:uncharacterized protein PV08_10133 [Exophiala spinifera]KIW10834.1 hypothetical protein PV08_10133 [Exophiala spinifera]
MAENKQRRGSDRTLLNSPVSGCILKQSLAHGENEAESVFERTESEADQESERPKEIQRRQSLDLRHPDDEEQNAPENPPTPVGLFHSSLRPVWRQVIKKWLVTVVIIMCFILCILSLYWSVIFHAERNLSAITVAVVDFDSNIAPYDSGVALVGPVVEQLAREHALKRGSLGYVVHPPSQYNDDPLAVRQAVYDEHIWAAVIVNAEATTLLQRAVATGNQTYDPLGAGHFIVNSARDQKAYTEYIMPLLSQFQTSAASIFAEQWIPSILSNSSLSSTTYSRSPQALNPAIGFSTVDLRPFEPYQVTPAVTIGLIYLIIMAFFSFSFFLPVYTEFLIPRGHPSVHFWQLVLIRLFATTCTYCLMSLSYSLVSLAFQIPFSSNSSPHSETGTVIRHGAFGKGTFVVYWMLNWVGMYALGLASENVSMIIGQPWTAFWLIFWVITNVSTSFYTISLAPKFFRFGYVWPLYHIVKATRILLFDLHSRIGLNFGVLFAWCAINTVLYPFCCVFMRWKSDKDCARRVPRKTIKYLVDG